MRKDKLLYYSYALLLGFLWPLFQIFLYLIRFYQFPNELVSSLYFYPMGVLSFFFLLFLSEKVAKEKREKIFIGYLFAVPLAAVFSLIGFLIITPWIGVTVMGSIPLILGTFIGYKKGNKKQQIQ